MTKGEYRVGINFNPASEDIVFQIKRQAADLIDLIDLIRASTDGDDTVMEVIRLKALAQTHVEDAAMWAVKAATKPAN